MSVHTLSAPATPGRGRPTGCGERRPGPEAMAEARLGVTRFTRSLLHLSGPSIGARAARLGGQQAAPDDHLAWWQATLAVDRALRCAGLQQEAALSARLAAQAVLVAASRSGLSVTPEVTALARSAGEVARALVAGQAEPNDCLSRAWKDLLAPASPADLGGPHRPLALAQRGDRRGPAVGNQTRRGEQP